METKKTNATSSSNSKNNLHLGSTVGSRSTVIAKGILKAVAVLVGIALLLFLIYKIQVIIAYIVIASVVALIGRPVVIFFRRKLKLPNTIGALLAMVLIFSILMGIFALIIPLLTEQGKNLYMLDINIIQSEFDKLYLRISEYLGTSKNVVEEIAEDTEIEKNVVDSLDKGYLAIFVRSLVNVITNFGVGLFSVLFISFFFLKDSTLIQKVILTLAPDGQQPRALISLGKIKTLLSRYFVGLLIQMSILFVIYSLTLLLVGIKNALVIAFMCSLFNIIPYIGPIIGSAIMVMLTVTSNVELEFSSVILPKIGYVLIGVVFGQLIDNFLSQPLIYSGSVKSHPLEIFLVIIIAGLLFGIVGMIIAVPSYTVVKVVLKEFLPENSIVLALTKNL